MSGIQVTGCVAAIVSAFHSGAELIHIIKERKDRNWRRKEKELEQSVQEKMLHASLVEGASQCHLSSVDRSQRFGLAYDSGDAIATSVLKDVMTSLQSEVMMALRIARDVGNAVLDLTRLHEASITIKNNALRAMDELCQRIMAAVSIPHSPEHEHQSCSFARHPLQYPNNDALGPFQTVSANIPASVSIPDQPIRTRPSSIIARMQSIRHISEGTGIQRAASKASTLPIPPPHDSVLRSMRRHDIEVYAYRHAHVHEDDIHVARNGGNMSLDESAKSTSEPAHSTVQTTSSYGSSHASSTMIRE